MHQFVANALFKIVDNLLEKSEYKLKIRWCKYLCCYVRQMIEIFKQLCSVVVAIHHLPFIHTASCINEIYIFEYFGKVKNGMAFETHFYLFVFIKNEQKCTTLHPLRNYDYNTINLQLALGIYKYAIFSIQIIITDVLL